MLIGPGITIDGGIGVDTIAAAPTPFVTSGLQFNLQSAPVSGSLWTDASGNGYNATLQGSASYTAANGGGVKLNNSTFAGNDYISVPYNISSSTVTVEIIASFNPTSYWSTIWGNDAYSAGRGYLAYLQSATGLTHGTPSNPAFVTITASNAIRQWIFVINGNNYSLYINGTQLGTSTLTTQTNFVTSELYFGARHTNNGVGPTDKLNNSNASLYPVFYQMRLYNKALSGAEITQNYNAVKGTYGI
jgi:hypothetical protein